MHFCGHNSENLRAVAVRTALGRGLAEPPPSTLASGRSGACHVRTAPAFFALRICLRFEALVAVPSPRPGPGVFLRFSVLRSLLTVLKTPLLRCLLSISLSRAPDSDTSFFSCAGFPQPLFRRICIVRILSEILRKLLAKLRAQHVWIDQQSFRTAASKADGRHLCHQLIPQGLVDVVKSSWLS